MRESRLSDKSGASAQVPIVGLFAAKASVRRGSSVWLARPLLCLDAESTSLSWLWRLRVPITE